MRRRIALLAAGASLLLALPARAQIAHFKYIDAGAGRHAFGVYIGTYRGVRDFGGENAQSIGFNCVDYFHEVMRGQEWDARISSLGNNGDISFTRHPESLDVYRQAAWLISNYDATNVQATQSTLWNLFAEPGANWPIDAGLLAQARALHPGFDYSQFYVVTDVNAGGPNDASSVQEFVVWDPTIPGTQLGEAVTTTPEPGSVVLFATGLLVVVRLRSRLRRNLTTRPPIA